MPTPRPRLLVVLATAGLTLTACAGGGSDEAGTDDADLDDSTRATEVSGTTEDSDDESPEEPADDGTTELLPTDLTTRELRHCVDVNTMLTEFDLAAPGDERDRLESDPPDGLADAATVIADGYRRVIEADRAGERIDIAYAPFNETSFFEASEAFRAWFADACSGLDIRGRADEIDALLAAADPDTATG